jgi:nicotinate-nucleotide adenylyltransferase
MTKPKNIALFGGTFDPIHLGHLMIAEEAMNSMDLDEVRFLPCRISPHKTDRPPTPGNHRLRMIQLATDQYPWAVADGYELNGSGPSYSYLTVAEIRRRHPDARIFWLMGCDQWEALPRWREPEKLSTEVEFIVFSRNKDPVPRPGWKLHRLKGVHPASSTEIRNQLLSGQSPPDWLPPVVLTYIRENHLYTG